MTEEIKKRLLYLAESYETADFINGDPSCFLHRYSDKKDTEIAAFIAAMLSFGRRDLFLPKIEGLLDTADRYGGPYQWIKTGKYLQTVCSGVHMGVSDSNELCIDVDEDTGKNICSDIPQKFSEEVLLQKKFYRFYSYKDLIDLLDAFFYMLKSYNSFGDFMKRQYTFFFETAQGELNKPKSIILEEIIGETFSSCKIVPKGKNSANKRVHMFLRWMVRQNSPVDIGLWNWFDASNLLIPLDTHVLQESYRLGILDEKICASKKTAQKITDCLKEIWPEDPCRGDFALFGLGVDKNP